MPILTPTDITGRVAWIGRVPDRAAGLASEPLERAELTLDGIAGEAHGGATRPACSRVKLQYPRGVELRNARQLSVLSVEELAEIAAAMGLERLEPAWLGASLVFEGVPALTTLPPSSRLIFPSGAGIVVDMENAPCKYPAELIEGLHPGRGLSFPKHAAGRRGVTAWVERAGPIALGDVVRLHAPPQRLYAPLQRAEAAAGEAPQPSLPGL